MKSFPSSVVDAHRLLWLSGSPKAYLTPQPHSHLFPQSGLHRLQVVLSDFISCLPVFWDSSTFLGPFDLDFGNCYRFLWVCPVHTFTPVLHVREILFLWMEIVFR